MAKIFYLCRKNGGEVKGKAKISQPTWQNNLLFVERSQEGPEIKGPAFWDGRDIREADETETDKWPARRTADSVTENIANAKGCFDPSEDKSPMGRALQALASKMGFSPEDMAAEIDRG